MVRSQHQQASQQEQPAEASGQDSDGRTGDPTASQELPETPRKAGRPGAAGSLSRLSGEARSRRWHCQVCSLARWQLMHASSILEHGGQRHVQLPPAGDRYCVQPAFAARR